MRAEDESGSGIHVNTIFGSVDVALGDGDEDIKEVRLRSVSSRALVGWASSRLLQAANGQRASSSRLAWSSPEIMLGGAVALKLGESNENSFGGLASGGNNAAEADESVASPVEK